MQRYTNSTDNRFKYFMIGIVSLIVLLFLTIMIINIAEGNILEEEKIHEISKDVYGDRNEDEYLAYFYSDDCSYCQQLMNTTTYNNYIKDAKIPLYKIDIYSAPIKLREKYALTETPMMLHVKRNANGKLVVIDKLNGADKIEAHLKEIK